MTREQRFAAMVKERNAKVFKAALMEALEVGFYRMTRDGIATRARVAAGCVNKAYGDMNRLRDAVMEHAVSHKLLGIVAQGLAGGHAVARNAPPDLKERALDTLT